VDEVRHYHLQGKPEHLGLMLTTQQLFSLLTCCE